MVKSKKTEPVEKAAKSNLKEYTIEHGKHSVDKVRSTNMVGIYARGSGISPHRGSGKSGYAGNVKIITETDVISISWERNGKPHISIYSLDNDYGVGKIDASYFQVMDKRGKVYTKWVKEIDYGWEPSQPIVDLPKKRKRNVRSKKIKPKK